MAMIDRHFDPKTDEQALYDAWEKAGCFKPDTSKKADGGDKEPYTVILPPPNVTGSLHMGHALNHTVQDILCRYQRMRGKNVLWQPGTDHAGIATQLVVERQWEQSEEGQASKNSPAYINRLKGSAQKWAKESGARIREQIRRLGSSLDWSRDKFTLDPDMQKAVARAFVKLYEDGLIYRDRRVVHWDPQLQTALSDLEVEQKQVAGTLWHIRYKLADGKTYAHPLYDANGIQIGSETRDYLTVATTRPETMFGDTAVAVHPDDYRYSDLIGQFIILPLTGRHIPIIADTHANPDKGSGAVKITPAHDFDDFDVGKRHKLPMPTIMGMNAKIVVGGSYEHSDSVEVAKRLQAYLGLDRYVARERVLDALKAENLLDKEEDTIIDQPIGGRSGCVIEPLLTDQWYLDVKQMAERALDAVDKDETRFIPENWEKTFRHWMDTIQPWCISRQLWWGHQLPVWFAPPRELDKGLESKTNLKEEVFVAEDEVAVEKKIKELYGEDVIVEISDGLIMFRSEKGLHLRRSPDVLDTWFSSALWPFSTQGWPDEGDPDFKIFYPGAALVTAHDIIFFWVARMMMMGLHFTDKTPFRDVYLHAIVRDEQGRKMSKSEGNTIDPLDLIDGIGLDELVKKRTTGLRQPEKAPRIAAETRKHYPGGFDAYGADALRFTLAAMATGGQHINLSVERVAGYRNFGTKLWNATRFAQMNEVVFGDRTSSSASPDLAINKWIIAEVAKATTAISQAIEAYRFNDAASAVYRFIRDILCDWYIELAKPVLYGRDEKAKAETRRILGWTLEQSFKLLHPFSPFITEKLWQETADRSEDGDSEDKQKFLMSQSWPQGGPTTAPEKAPAQPDTAADDIGWVMDVVSTIRSVRADMNVPAGIKLPVCFIGSGLIGARRVKTYRETICRLAHLESFELADKAAPGWATAVTGDTTLALDIASRIDVGAEIARLEKQLGKIRAEMGALEKRMLDKTFRARAPEHIIAQQSERLGQLQDMDKKLDKARQQLGKL